MKRVKRRASALLLALVMVLGLCPVLPVQAAAPEEDAAAPSAAAPIAETQGAGDEMGSAIPLTPGKATATTLAAYENKWYSVTTEKAGQFISLALEKSDGYYLRADFYDSTGKQLYEYGSYNGSWTCSAVTDAVGVYYIRFYVQGACAVTCTATLIDNDKNEPNNTRDTATALREGETADFTVGGNDEDWFKVTTTKPGQDIAITISGYNYTNNGNELRLTYYGQPDSDESSGYADISTNRTLYFHAAEAGEHHIMLMSRYSSTSSLALSISAQVLDGDANEPNDTRDTATRLTLNTDASFTVGGFGDEDWFTFEAAPEGDAGKLYTLNFLDLNPNYSDSFFYDIYAPDGTAVSSGSYVNIRHLRNIECTQQGLYAVRVYTVAGLSKDYNNYLGKKMDYPRAALRIRVDEGGDDPYESNDTWQTAVQIEAGETISHVLATTDDQDWFCFVAPEDNMVLHLTSSKSANIKLYSAEDLYQYGASASAMSSGATPEYWKLGGAGVYYLCLYAYSANYTSTEVRTTTVTLLPAEEEENNDTWQQATRLYDGVPQHFTNIAINDKEWFKIVLPERGRVYFDKDDNNDYGFSLYREQDFLEYGDNADRIFQSYHYRYYDILADTLEAGTYYLRINGTTGTDGADIWYTLLAAGENGGMKTAAPLAAGEWGALREDGLDSWFSLGALKAGDVLRYSMENDAYVYLVNAEGKQVGYHRGGYYAFSIPSDGEYYLKVSILEESSYGYNTVAWSCFDANHDPAKGRIRYDIGRGESYVTEIEAPDEVTLYVGDTVYLDLRLAPYDAMSVDGDLFKNYNTTVEGSGFSWSSDTGYLTAESAGTGTLTVRCRYAKKTIRITVLEREKGTIAVENAPATLALGEKAYLSARVQPESAAGAAANVTWASSDTKVLYVFGGGKVVAVGSGTATVTASCGAFSDSVTITVPESTGDGSGGVTALSLDRYRLTLYVGEAGTQLAAAVQPAGTAITWSSSNTKVASVLDGRVTPNAAGTAVITAKAGDRSVSCIVTVLPQRVRVSGIRINGERTIELPLGGEVTLSAAITPDNATVQTVLWTSGDDSIATVSRTGIVTPLSVGTVRIRATAADSDGGTIYDEITLVVVADGKLGDINRDGAIDAGDAIICLQAAVGKRELTDEEFRRADVNHDGLVDAGDAVKILRYSVGLIDSLE